MRMGQRVIKIVTAVLFSAAAVVGVTATAQADPGWGRSAPEVTTTVTPTPSEPTNDPGWG
ncbi:hypothetical protein QEH31_gp30 [Streptomyces phage Chymera]|uniref:Uncharacterized protein n=1 Tax=Streptomyces phage Chymera TaxID=1821728 RepID=A0A142K656_9CAUD|nr:hypothetical protein QEH31_gp30 [Streptomyces phage Chymera]AMS01589.1 hypothetical protein SEA_CHYMERA_30 [Streptomyces phage Chymera]APE22055.1 hypothetical protein vnz_14195 [Streptomyces venezuelae]QER99444.1 hypothetical protein DEJ43_14375 [Streptomyces venezuelae ATCC 10712]